MTNKTTKRALLASIVSLVLCFSMLLGTTYAWFTDSASSVNNVIKSGNLDVVLEVGTLNDGGASANPNDWTWTALDLNQPIINLEDVEPGYVATKAIRIRNNGSLAFKYQLSTAIVSETTVANIEGGTFKLSDYLYTFTSQSLSFTDYSRDQILSIIDISLAGNFNDGFGAGTSNTSVNRFGDIVATDLVLKEGESQAFAFAVAMPTWVDNKANHAGVAPQLTFGINVLATQFTYEKDSFGNDYDTNAEYPVIESYDHVVSTPAALVEAFKNGGSIKLEGNIELDERLNLSAGTEVYLNMNGKTITATDPSVDPVFYTSKDSKLTIDGNGTVILDNPSMSLIFPGGDVVIENGTFTRTVPAGTPANQVGALFVGAKVDPWGSQTVTINGGYFDGGYYDANAADIDELLDGTKTLAETEDDIAKRGNSADKNAVRVALKNNTQLTLNLSYNLMKIYGGTFVGMNPAWGDEGCMLPTTPNYLRPWSYYQGALLDGQTFNENGIVLPDGYTITKGSTTDGRPTYTVEYSK